MPGLESVLLAVYSEGEGKDLVEVRRLVVQVYELNRSVSSCTGYELSVFVFSVVAETFILDISRPFRIFSRFQT